jgi:1,4-dihydroxy-2-naphthoate octaprenyltransferase
VSVTSRRAANLRVHAQGPAKWKAYARLMKLNNPDLALYPLVTMAMASGQYHEVRYWLILVLFTLFSFCCQALSLVLDDIEGYLDGVDQLGAQGKKKNQPKPLLSGELTVAQARRAAWFLCGTGLALLPILVRLSSHPLLATLVLVATFVVPTQYSYGLKLSYYGLGEFVIIYGAAMTAFVPYWLLHGTAPMGVLLASAMCGLPFAALVVNSHILDYEADRATNRRTLTVILGIARVRWVAVSLIALFWVLYVVGFAGHAFPRTALLWLVLLPVHLKIVQVMLKGDSPRARLLAFLSARVQLVLFLLAFLLANHRTGIS